MPELPEVETVCEGLRQTILNDKLSQTDIHRSDLRISIPENFKEICNNSTIKDVSRRAKYFLIHLDNGNTIIGHLGMSGKILAFPNKRNILEKHDHVCWRTETGKEIVFNDPRRFGLLTFARTSEVKNHPLFSHLGPEPLEDSFNGEVLFSSLRKRKTSIKQAIMDAKTVVGVGNIYASEVLFRTKIDPREMACNITLEKCKEIACYIKQVLAAAIKSGGSTLKDYVGSSGEKGYFQHNFKVYGRENEPCSDCKHPIKRIVQSNRSTFFCEECQK